MRHVGRLTTHWDDETFLIGGSPPTDKPAAPLPVGPIAGGLLLFVDLTINTADEMLVILESSSDGTNWASVQDGQGTRFFFRFTADALGWFALGNEATTSRGRYTPIPGYLYRLQCTVDGTPTNSCSMTLKSRPYTAGKFRP